MNTRLIGLTGKEGSGKDTVARLILSIIFDEIITEETYFENYRDCDFLGFKAEVITFAYPLYNMLSAFTGKSVTWLLKNKDSTINGKTVRYLLQTLGTEWGRNTINENIWVDYLDLRVKALPHDKLIIIPDVWFDNEADYIRNNSGEIWHIHKDVNILHHASENGIYPMSQDKIIINNLSIDELKSKVAECLHDSP